MEVVGAEVGEGGEEGREEELEDEIPPTQPSPEIEVPEEFLTRQEQNTASKADSPARKGKGKGKRRGKGKGSAKTDLKEEPQASKPRRGRKAKPVPDETQVEEPKRKGRAAKRAKPTDGEPSVAGEDVKSAAASRKRKVAVAPEPAEPASSSRKRKQTPAEASKPSEPASSSRKRKQAPAGSTEEVKKTPPPCRASRKDKEDAAKITPPKVEIDRATLKKEIKPFCYSSVVPYWSRPACGLKVANVVKKGEGVVNKVSQARGKWAVGGDLCDLIFTTLCFEGSWSSLLEGFLPAVPASSYEGMLARDSAYCPLPFTLELYTW